MHHQLAHEERQAQQHPTDPQNGEHLADSGFVVGLSASAKSEQHFHVENARYSSTGHKHHKVFDEEAEGEAAVEQVEAECFLAAPFFDFLRKHLILVPLH